MADTYRAATDVGGTFTDLVYYDIDPETKLCGPVQVDKTDTTPPDFELGVMAALARAGLDPGELSFFAHGTTVVDQCADGAKRREDSADHHQGVS